MLVAAVAEVVTLGAVLPFIAVLTAPDRVFAYPIVAAFAGKFGIVSAEQLALPITIAFVLSAIVAGGVRMLSLWANTRLAYSTGADLGIEVYRRSLYQPYLVHTSRNTSTVLSAVARNVDAVVTGVLRPALLLAGSVVLFAAIIFALFAIDPLAASIAILGFGSFYAVINVVSRARLRKNGARIAKEQTQIFKALQEGLNGIRDVILDGTEEHYVRIYRQADLPLRRAQGNNFFIGQSPRFIMEAVGITLIAFLAFVLSRQTSGMVGALPVLGALALGGQRMLPALQQIYSSWSSMVGSQAILLDTVTLLDQPLPRWAHEPAPPPLKFEHEIRFVDVRFRYDDNSPWVLDGLNLVIPKGARVGLAGSTGSGKSTAMDLLLGLLTPTEGALLVDGTPLDADKARAWQRNIAHVPQNIYLSDASFAENIALGERPEAIDINRVRLAAQQARIAEFIERSPDRYDGMIGENGIRLSGGQRQRLGIARALYKDASVLVFDEATSALDNDTEQSVMDAINGLGRNLTILLIAHRLTTLINCDHIIELEHGAIVGQGTYDGLLMTSSRFRHMANIKEAPKC